MFFSPALSAAIQSLQYITTGLSVQVKKTIAKLLTVSRPQFIRGIRIVTMEIHIIRENNTFHVFQVGLDEGDTLCFIGENPRQNVSGWTHQQAQQALVNQANKLVMTVEKKTNQNW